MAPLRSLVALRDDLVAFIQARVGSRSLAEGILRDAFLGRGADKGRPGGHEPSIAWFFRVLREAVIDYQRRHEVTTQGLAALAADLDDQFAGPAELHALIVECIARYTEHMEPEQARGLRRIEIDGLAIGEYAAEVGIRDPKVVVVWVYLAREALKDLIRRSFTSAGPAATEDGSIDAGSTR